MSAIRVAAQTAPSGWAGLDSTVEATSDGGWPRQNRAENIHQAIVDSYPDLSP